MEGREYAYNGRIWHPRPTIHDKNSFFHAVFGEGQLRSDKNASFRRRCLGNFLTYFESVTKPEALKEYLEKVLNVRESNENFSTLYRNFVKEVSSSDHRVLVNEIPLIATLENVIIVAFVGDKDTPEIFAPQEDLLGNYPWKTKTDTKGAIVCFRENNYSRLEFDRRETEDIPTDPPKEESILEDEEKDEVRNEKFFAKYYPKLSGCAGIKGSLYQINLLTIYLLNGSKSFQSLRLSTENKTAGKFDDVVLETLPNKGFLLQAKHRQNKKITCDDLYTTNPDKDHFSLPMYYLSYQKIKNNFEVQKMTLCTNTDLKCSRGCNPTEIVEGYLEEDDPLYFPDMKHCRYTFSDTIVSFLALKAKEYKDNHLKDQTFAHNVYDDDQVKEFLSKFQLVTGYSNGNDLESVVERMLQKENYCSRYDTRDCSKYLNNKMVEWFESEKGRYLTQDTLKIFLSEFRSNKFCEKLRNFQMDIGGNGTDYSGAKRLLLLDSRRGYVLNMIKVYCALYGSKSKYFFLSPNEDVSRQIEMVEAFRGSSYDTLVACFKISDSVRAGEICDKLTDLVSTDKYSNKRIILITGRNDPLGNLLKEKNRNGFEEVFENITFKDLTGDSQKRLLRRVIQLFHTSI